MNKHLLSVRSWVNGQSVRLRTISNSSVDSMCEMFGNFLQREPSPNNSRASSRRASILQMMGKSTDSALSNETENGTTGLARVPSKKNSIQKASAQTQSCLDEYRSVHQEHAKLKRIIDQIKGEYEDSKSFEVFRRYEKLKGMIKRTVMYIKLENLPDVGTALGVGGLLMMSAGLNRKASAIYGNVADIPKSQIPEKLKQLKRRISLIRSQIEQLSESYEHSKQFIAFQRYGLMKAMIKQLLSNCAE